MTTKQHPQLGRVNTYSKRNVLPKRNCFKPNSLAPLGNMIAHKELKTSENTCPKQTSLSLHLIQLHMQLQQRVKGEGGFSITCFQRNWTIVLTEDHSLSSNVRKQVPASFSSIFKQITANMSSVDTITLTVVGGSVAGEATATEVAARLQLPVLGPFRPVGPFKETRLSLHTHTLSTKATYSSHIQPK